MQVNPQLGMSLNMEGKGCHGTWARFASHNYMLECYSGYRTG